MLNSSSTLLPIKRFNENNTKFNTFHSHFKNPIHKYIKSSIKFLPITRFNDNHTKISTKLINLLKLQLESSKRKSKQWKKKWLTMVGLEQEVKL